MSRFELPEGVPADNEGLTARAQFSAPDMATPDFARSAADYSRVVVVVDDEEGEEDGSEVVVKKEEDDDDDSIDFPMPSTRWLVIDGLAVALVALAYMVSSKQIEPQPYCSQQPDWNQYNCIPG